MLHSASVMTFKMDIVDIFHLSSGYTVFVGVISGYDSLIKHGIQAEILVDGKAIKVIELHGEWIANRSYDRGYKGDKGHRSLSTLEAIELTSAFVKEHSCILRSV
jgi:hypothetical protein